jgi:preprotein translocase subunit YajC
LNLILFLAQTAPAPAPPAPQWLELLRTFGPFIPLIILFYILVFGAKRKQERERKTLLDSLKKGDRVRMGGGELGAIVEVRDNKVLLKVDESSNTKIWYVREAVVLIEKEEAAKT